MIDNELAAVISSIGTACKQIGSLVNRAGISNLTGLAGETNVQARAGWGGGAGRTDGEQAQHMWGSVRDGNLRARARACVAAEDVRLEGMPRS